MSSSEAASSSVTSKPRDSTTPAPPASTGDAKRTPEERIDALTDDIASLEERISEKTHVLNEKRKQRQVDEIDADVAEREAKEADERLAAAQAEFRKAEQARVALVPRHEHALQNRDQHQKASEYKTEISNTEKAIREADEKIKGLEGRLQAVSADYKNEREKRCLLVDRVATMLDDLRSAVEEKVMLTLPIDENADGPHISACFRGLGEAAREREVAIAQCARHAAELAATVRMKQQRVVELRVESDRDIAAVKAVKDEQIKRMALKFDEERRCLQQDIDAVEEANKQCEEQLKHPKQAASDREGPNLGAGPATHGPSKRDAARPVPEAITRRTKELEQERERLQREIKRVTAEKGRLVKSMRGFEEQIRQKEAEHAKTLHTLENQIHRDKNASVQLEKENLRLAEACDALMASVEAARRARTESPSKDGGAAATR